jgi:hypothetical protein
MASSLQQGINAAKAGQMQTALNFLKDAIIEEPQNADVWVWIAAIIDDPQKQEIFLDKALQIDPTNIPAQRGMAYIQKQKQDADSQQGEHLSDYTKPISPFPNPQKAKKQQESVSWSKISDNEVKKITGSVEYPTKSEGAEDQAKQKLSLFELTLLGIVVLVFCFIGLLAASSIFKFELPLDILSSKKPRLISEPPYPGVFLYENEVFFDIREHTGTPESDLGIPTSFERQPTIVFWETQTTPESLRMIYENGAVIPIGQYLGKGGADIIQPEDDVKNGLYCLQGSNTQFNGEPQYWCFIVAPIPIIEQDEIID